MLGLQCGAQKYEWGRPAINSEVAQLAKSNGVEIDESKPYAELWMGTHPNCPSLVASTEQPLSTWIKAHPESVGPAVLSRFGADLPFLFKVLSVNKALSIQSHPDKQLAEKLHNQHPKLYPDDNHKPEMALALGDDFEALCAFAPLEEVVAALDTHPELATVVGRPARDALAAATDPEQQKQALQAAFTALMTASPEAVAHAVSSLVDRLQQVGDNLAPHDKLALRLDAQYPGGDVGVLASYFLNYVTLRAGQALFLGANEPHAYLAGEIVECMAASDNVIRAGLTPKFKHADVLCASLTYAAGLPEVYEGAAVGAGDVRVYRPPTQEFEIRHVAVAPGGAAALAPDPGPQVLLVQQGEGTAAARGPLRDDGLQTQGTIARGSVWFIPSSTAVELTAAPGKPLQCWVAAVNSTFFALHSALSSSAPAAAASAAEAELAAA